MVRHPIQRLRRLPHRAGSAIQGPRKTAVRRQLRRGLGGAAVLVALAATLGPLLHRQAGLPPVDTNAEATARSPLQARHLALVINTADPVSDAIGRHYQAARRLPTEQVIRVRFRPGPTLSVPEFQRVMGSVRRQTPSHVQAYALAWAAPWRVGCVSITSAFAFGRLRSGCANTCDVTPTNPWYARGDIHRPWSALGIRPAMLLAATDPTAGIALIDRGVAADGSAPPGTVYLFNTSDRPRNVRADSYPFVRSLLGASLEVRVLQSDALGAPRDAIALFTGLPSIVGLQGSPRPGMFRPGAVADHLTSSAGMLTGSSGTSRDGGNGQMSALRWLEAGATGSYGTVVEPCNLTSKFPDPGLLLTYYRRGDTLLESYWRSVAMPEQGVFIGEPLARPWPTRS